MPSLSSARRLARTAALVVLTAPACGHADAQEQPAPVLDEVLVDAQADPAQVFEPTQATTLVGPDELARRQPSNLFDAVRDVPGVSVNGGPRASGMTFSIRGFDDPEDVQVRLDGVTKQFEKYRFGGTFIDPELLKQVEVQRGPRITSGSGALGGTVSATTKDAADLLRAGERFGVRGQAGYATNNDETLLSLSAFGRPTQATDVLVNVLTRTSGDYRLPDGTAYQYSATDTQSALFKGSMFLLEDLRCSLSLIGFEDSGLQPYDATGGQPGVGGNVRRDVRDRTASATVEYQPGGRWINLRATLGYGQTRLHDFLTPELSGFATPYPPGTGDLNDYYDYDIWNLDIANTSVLGRLGPWTSLSVTTGLQYEHNQRDVVRYAQNPAFNAPGGQWAGGFNPSQPPGTKRNAAAYLQPRVDIGRLGLVPGVRWDRYEVEADGGTLALLEPYGQPSEVAYDRVTWSFGASFALLRDRLTAFYNYSEGFRPPLIDEAFSQGTFGRCNPLNLGALAPDSRICGDLYEPEESVTQEVGMSFVQPGFGGASGFLAAKATWFWSDTDQLLESITVQTPGVVSQPGWEKRNGVELEGRFDTGRLFASATYAHVEGSTYTCPNFYCLPAFPGLGLGRYPLYDVPGDTLGVTIGARFFERRLELSYGLLDVGARNVIKDGKLLGQPDAITRQESYLLHGAAARLMVGRHLELRLTGENLTNETYFLYQGAYQGAQAPGRNVRFTIAAQY